MNVLYIFGNGFDKAQGMATSYPEFYKHLQENVTDGSALFIQMKKRLTEEIELWSDMEDRLGDFTAQCADADEFYDFYFELNDHLQKYLISENDKFVPTDNLKNKFLSDFSVISKYLGELDKVRYNTFIRNSGYSHKEVSVITLNYTDTLEKILSLNGGSISKSLGNNADLREIIHVHGKLGNSVIIGVDNEDQMKNEEFRKNEDIKDLMIKIQSNQVMKETRHMRCKELINEANVVVLFGVSLGDTDARWWKILGDNLLKRGNVVVIQHLFDPNAVISTQLQKRGRLERQKQKCLMQKMGIEEENFTEELRNRLFFIVNEPVFII